MSAIEIPVTLLPLRQSFEGQRNVILTEANPVMLGRFVDGTDTNGPGNHVKFTSKVVSRKHAQLIFADSKIWLQDTKSSSGTFLNDSRLSSQGTESARFELRNGDIIRLGEDCEVNGVLHQSVVMRIILPLLNDQATSKNHAKYQSNLSLQDNHSLAEKDTQSMISEDAHQLNNVESSSFVDLAGDQQVRMDIDNEFNAIWSSLNQGLDNSVRRLQAIAKGYANNMITQGFYSGYTGMDVSYGGGANPRQSLMPFGMLNNDQGSESGSFVTSARFARGSRMGGPGLSAAMSLYGGGAASLRGRAPSHSAASVVSQASHQSTTFGRPLTHMPTKS